MDGEKEVKPVEVVEKVEEKEIDPVEAMQKKVMALNDDASALREVDNVTE